MFKVFEFFVDSIILYFWNLFSDEHYLNLKYNQFMQLTNVSLELIMIYIRNMKYLHDTVK